MPPHERAKSAPSSRAITNADAVRPTAFDKAREFLSLSTQFRLGALPTEQPHPKTGKLSQLAQSKIEDALMLFLEVERDAFTAISPRLEEIEALGREMQATLNAGRRVFFCGCGATGRLSLATEVLWRRHVSDRGLQDRVVSFMAGGDYALVRSIENFEDHPEYGARQLYDLGFQPGDLLVACTEGGETPFVIGAAEAAADACVDPEARRPWFLYCNPDDILNSVAERSRRVLANARIQKLNLTVGPMAITGSTRLQATSVLTFAAASALLWAAGAGASPREEHARLLRHFSTMDLSPLAPLIEHEADLYQAGELCLHVCREQALTVLTDLTERSPTFSVPPMENSVRPELGPAAWTFLEVPETATSSEAWHVILGRPPRALEWPELKSAYGQTVVLGFDFSGDVAGRRRTRLASGTYAPNQSRYSIAVQNQSLVLELAGRKASFAGGDSRLSESLTLKLLLNASSTLVMGRCGRFEGNVMLWVKSSNNKLIDRSIRYIDGLLRAEELTPPSYEDIAQELFAVLESIGPNEPAVLRTRDRIRSRLRTT